MKNFTVTVDEDPYTGDLILPLPDELLNEVGWECGDTIEWTDNEDGTYSLTKKQETELVMVECVQQFRIRYLVEVPKGKAEWALDTVTMNEADEFTQLSLGETIVSHRVVSEDEAIAVFDEDNTYAKSWTREQKLGNVAK